MKKSKNVWLLGFTSLFNDVSSELIYSSMPFYLAKLGYGTFEVGLLAALVNGLSSVLKMLFGMLADIGKKKPLVFLGYFTSAVSKFIIAVARNVKAIAAAVIFDRIGKGIRTSPRDALLAEYKKKARAFGIHRALDTLGAILGSFLAFIFIEKGLISEGVLIGAVIGFLSLVPLLFVVETGQRVKKKEVGFKFTPLLIPMGLQAFSLIPPLVLISTLSRTFGASSLLAYIIFNVVYDATSLLVARFGDAFDKRVLLFLGYLTSSASMILAGMQNLLALPLYGVAYGLIQPISPAIISGLFAEKGSALGSYYLVTGLAIFAGSTFFGKLLEASLTPYFAAASISAVSAIAIFAVSK